MKTKNSFNLFQQQQQQEEQENLQEAHLTHDSKKLYIYQFIAFF